MLKLRRTAWGCWLPMMMKKTQWRGDYIPNQRGMGGNKVINLHKLEIVFGFLYIGLMTTTQVERRLLPIYALHRVWLAERARMQSAMRCMMSREERSLIR